MQRNAGAFNLEDDEEGGEEEGAAGEGVGDDDEMEPVLDDLGLPKVDPARVNYPLFRREVWAAVDWAFGIEDVDMKDAITAKYDAFYKKRGAFTANLSLIATEWRNLEAQAVQFGVKILKKKKAEYLMNAVPLELQTILRITLKQEPHDPKAILREIKELASAAGNSLDLGRSGLGCLVAFVVEVVDMDVATAAAEEVNTGVVPVGTVLVVLVSSRPAAALEEEDKQGEAEVDSEVVVMEVLSPGKGARTKDEADQHLLYLIIAEQIIPKIIQSDNDTVLKLGKTKQLAAEYNIYLEPSPQHCPESHGAVEVANREIRTMLRTALKEIGYDAYVWPVLIPGIEPTHNVTFASLTGLSPWLSRFQSPPPFVLRFGDPVVFKPPSADKSLSFLGMEGVFIDTVNDTLCEVLYYPPETERWTVCKLYPIVLKPVRRGVEEA
uniref:Integrase catalytic domain-containing protein n=1 Tax=Chromera velia CCMP2878 TaxID=1169474 RepID=A0A0G4F078_9ALVE|eukprot:Cvel_14540.t1-p1 / transcript=Cvel_14540.t1 / gene=Cvel_14540 / organism=Chromera_velia_CCMP2878 / gene_product=hypothetical protein / transcript_product=hypothetical protein / location=Cvel_scaffold1038:40888-45450(-) / protein_length=437 / sequence_SO=supercontig / SO=protein_coding / is_pseudo=false